MVMMVSYMQTALGSPWPMIALICRAIRMMIMSVRRTLSEREIEKYMVPRLRIAALVHLGLSFDAVEKTNVNPVAIPVTLDGVAAVGLRKS